MNLIFDLDDTLADCSIFYKEQIERFAEFQHDRTGISPNLIMKLREGIDVTFTSTPDGFSRVRFPRSFAATSTAIDIMLGNDIDDVAAYQSFELGDEVFNATYPLFDGVDDLLQSLIADGHDLFLLTKGDYKVQQRKIELNKLHRWFSSDRMYIVNQKTPDALKALMADHMLKASDTIVIGDSLRDDIHVANQLGIRSVWVSKSIDPKWSYENVQVVPTIHISQITELDISKV